MDSAFKWDIPEVCTITEKSAAGNLVETRTQNLGVVGWCRTKLTNIDMNEAFGRQGLCLAGRRLFGRCQGRCLGILQITWSTPPPPHLPPPPIIDQTPPCDISKVLFQNNLWEYFLNVRNFRKVLFTKFAELSRNIDWLLKKLVESILKIVTQQHS